MRALQLFLVTIVVLAGLLKATHVESPSPSPAAIPPDAPAVFFFDVGDSLTRCHTDTECEDLSF